LTWAAIAVGGSIGCSGGDPAQPHDNTRASGGESVAPAHPDAADPGASPDTGATSAAPAPRREFDSLDELLESCPSTAEVAEIHADIKIVLDPAVLAESASIHCTEGGDESSAALSIDNMFRAMRLIRFDRGLPLIGATNLYDWFKSSKISVHAFAASGPTSFSSASATTVHLNSFILSQANKRRWVDRYETVGMQDLVALLVHEARHTTRGGNLPHDCDGASDSSLAYGGAWALQYNFDVWMAEHVLPARSGQPMLTAFERSIATRTAEMVLAASFCDAQ
jgi:hypothetical protein